MVHPRSLIRPLVVTSLLVAAQTAYATPAAQQKPAANLGTGNSAGKNADPGNASQTNLFRRLQDIVGTKLTDGSGQEGTIVDLVADHGDQDQTPGNFSYVAVNFPQIHGGTTFLVPSSYLTLPPRKLALEITTHELTSMPVLTDQQTLSRWRPISGTPSPRSSSNTISTRTPRWRG